MAEHAYMESWQTDPDWKVADTIEEQLKRPEGEGQETWNEMKSEVDHMIETGSVELAYRYDSEVQEVLRKAPPVDTKWVIVRKLKKCAETSKMMYDRMRSRLTLRGFKQREGSQYDKYGTFAPVMHLGSLVMILILAVLFKLHVRMADDSKAFTEGFMDYKLYTTLPKPFNKMKEYTTGRYNYGKDALWLLISAIYGVKQAARQYYKSVLTHATGHMKMLQSQRDPCVLIK